MITERIIITGFDAIENINGDSVTSGKITALFEALFLIVYIALYPLNIWQNTLPGEQTIPIRRPDIEDTVGRRFDGNQSTFWLFFVIQVQSILTSYFLPSGKKTTDLTNRLWPSSVRLHSHDTVFQSLTVHTAEVGKTYRIHF